MSRGVAHVIVGVARTSTYDAFGEAPTPLVLYSYRDRPLAAAEMHLRTRPGTELAMASAIRRVVADLDPSLPVFDVRTLPEHIARNLVLRRVPARMFLVLGPLLLLLAAIGVYAVVDYGVSQRTSEIAVRLALGATSQAVVRRIVAETLAVIGLGVGGVHASWPSRWTCTWYAAGSATCPCWSACRCCSWRSEPWRRGCRRGARAASQPASVLRAI